jgi:hypothetical protein
VTARAGADHVFVLDDLPGPAAGEVADYWEGTAHRGDLSVAAREALDQLVLLGALLPAPVTAGTTMRVVVAFAGDTPPALQRALVAAVNGADRLEVGAAGQADLVIWVRTTATLAETATAAAGSPAPHLLVDAAYHHTVSLGPLVVPGETACLHCLAGRVTGRWGDPAPPPEPEVARLAPLVAGLVSVELRRAAAGACELANRTVALDLERWRIVDETVLRLPWCAGCGDDARARR